MGTDALLADAAVQRLLGVLPEARLVGGCVRDALLGRDFADIDLATPRHPQAVVDALAGAGLRALPTGLAHGTITALVQNRAFEVTTLRRDLATDGRHAEVAWTDDWREDAARRDFTINALSVSPDGLLHDYFGGASDLDQGRVRFVGVAAERVAEDYLRILRFFRFQARYGAGLPDAEALAAVAAGVPGLARLSAERVWGELKRILQAPDPFGALTLMKNTGVLAATIVEGADPDRAAGLPPDPILRLSAMLTGSRNAFATRLKLSTGEAARLDALAGPPPGGSDDDLRRQLADTPADILTSRSLIARQPDAMRERLSLIPRPVFPLEGRDALAIGLPPGPQVGALLRAVRGWWMQGGCQADAQACRAELARRAAA